MKFLSLHVQKFCVFQEPFVLPLSGQGLVLVEGKNWDAAGSADSNGAGKSMLFEAIPWALWGKMSRYGDRRVASELGEADVMVELEIAGEKFRIHRSRTAKGSAKLDVFTWKNTWARLQGSLSPVTANGDVTPLLGFDYDTFRSALFLQATGLTVTSAGFAAQTRLLEGVLRFDVLDAASTKARERARQIELDVYEAKTMVEKSRQTAAATDRTIKEFEVYVEPDQEASLIQQIEALTQLASVIPNLLQLQKVTKDSYRHAQAIAADRVSVWKMATSERADLLSLLDEPTGACSRCGQPIPKAKIYTLLDEADKAVEFGEQEARIAREEEESVRRLLDSRDLQLNQARESVASLGAKQEQLRDLRLRKARDEALLDKLHQQHQDETNAVVEWEQKLFDANARLLVAKFWVGGFSSDGLKADVLSKAAPVLNHAALRYSDLLTGGAIGVEFQPIRASKAEDMIRVSGLSATKYEGLSSGEKRRVDLIVALSLRELARWRLAQPLNVTLYDEVFDALDQSGLERAVAVIERDMDELETTFVVSHNPALKALFPGAKVIRVEREGGKSWLVI